MNLFGHITINDSFKPDSAALCIVEETRLSLRKLVLNILIYQAP